MVLKDFKSHKAIVSKDDICHKEFTSLDHCPKNKENFSFEQTKNEVKYWRPGRKTNQSVKTVVKAFKMKTLER